MSTLDQDLARLQTAKANIKTAINAKGGTLTDNDGFTDFPQAILNLPGQAGSITPSNIKSLVEPNSLAYDLASLVDAKIDIGNAIVVKGGTVTSSDGLEDFSSLISDLSTSHVYGFHIDSSKSDPTAAVTYLEDAVGKTPAGMNYSTGTFSYGSWAEDEFFMPRPCMVRSNGTVAYYLNPNDYTKKADGTASDISNTSFDGNAMMEWGRDGKKIWYKIVPDSGSNTSASIYIADSQVDSGYHAYSFINSSGNMSDHFYTPIYNGSYSNSKLRSLSGQTCKVSTTVDNEVSYATANGSGWYIETWGDRELINILLILLGKSLNTQSVFGVGNANGGSVINTGTMNDKGLFWGKNASSSSDKSGVKVFGMENWWGNIYRRTAGLIFTGGSTIRAKYCYGTSDGSTTSGYNSTGSGYINTGVSPTGTAGYLRYNNFANGMMIPYDRDGSGSTYYCDYFYRTTSTSTTAYAFCGGYYGGGSYCGAFYVSLFTAASYSNSNLGASLSFHP